MATLTYFAVPGQRKQLHNDCENAARKRKRESKAERTNLQPDETVDEDIALAPNTENPEYTAVLTPLERSQHRLAGLAFDQRPPARPFPHGPDTKQHLSVEHSMGAAPSGETHPQPQTFSKQALHGQHLAAISAILHRSMMLHDYNRASRALGLLLNSDNAGRAIDIRDEGLWGVGAEILLKYDADKNASERVKDASLEAVGREGFERAKAFYENLIVQFPQHKTWPDAVNARDFCIAMFGLWIFIVNQERVKLVDEEIGEDLAHPSAPSLALLRIKLWELEHAELIAETMDIRMRDVMFRDDSELVRLRAMVALWKSDVLEECSQLEEDESLHDSYEDTMQDMMDVASNIERITLEFQEAQNPHKSRAEAATESRKLATDLLNRLSGNVPNGSAE